MIHSDVSAAPRQHAGDTERYVGRALGLLWVFEFAGFWSGAVLGAVAGQLVASIVTGHIV